MHICVYIYSIIGTFDFAAVDISSEDSLEIFCFLVHFHCNVFCFDQWHSGGILQQYKGAASGGSTFSLFICDRDGGA